MSIGSMAVLIARAKIRPGSEDAFAAWKGRHDAAAAAFPGFVSSDIMPPSEHDDRWTLFLNFDSQEHLAAWQKSGERAAVLAELVPLMIGGDLGEVMQAEDDGRPETAATQVIFSQVKPGLEGGYREWATRMQQAQAHFPGYQGMYFQPPAPGGTHWITMLRFDTAEHLNAWLASPERAEMLKEAGAFVEREELLRLATSFPGWVRINPETGKGPPDWKTALLVLLGLYPIVSLEIRYLMPFLTGLNPAVSNFIGNVLSVAATSFLTMPYFVRLFDWWLFSDTNPNPRANATGLGILAAIFAVEIAFFAWLFS